MNTSRPPASRLCVAARIGKSVDPVEPTTVTVPSTGFTPMPLPMSAPVPPR